MANYNQVNQLSGGFIANSQKPIAGQVVRNAFLFQLKQAVVANGADLNVGDPVKLTNTSGVGGNVLKAEKPAAVADISGIIVESANDVVEIGDDVAKPREGQVAQVALIGSGIELYLPCEADLNNVNTNTLVTYDFVKKTIKKNTAGAGIGIKVVGGVVDGIRYTTINGKATTANAKVVKVKL